MSTILVAPGGGNWTSGGTWVGGAAPTLNDDAVADATSGNLTINASTAVANSLDCSGYTGTLTHNGSIILTLGSANSAPGNNALVFSSGMTYAVGSSLSTITFASTHATTQTVATAGKTMASLSFGGAGGSWVPASNIVATGSIAVSNGAFNAAGYDITCGNVTGSNTNTRILNPGSGHWTITGSGTVVNFATSTNLTIVPSSATFEFSNSSASLKTLAFGSKVYGVNVLLSGAGTGNYLFQGNNSFATLAVNPGVSMSVQTGNTQTITTAGGFQPFGSAVSPVNIGNSSQTGSISMASGVTIADYLTLQYSTVKGGGTFYAGINSVNNGNNSGWVFNVGALATNDSITTSESSSVVVSDPTISVSDTVTTDEYTQGYIAWNFSDKLSVSEAITMQIPQTFVTVSDTVTTSELSIVTRPLLELTMSDTVTLTESRAITAATDTPQIRAADHIIIQEGYKPQYNGFGAVYFGNTDSEAQNYNATQLVIGLSISVSDHITATDFLDVGSLSAHSSDTVTITEGPSFYSDLVATRESINVQLQQFTTEQEDTLTLTESFQVYVAVNYFDVVDLTVVLLEPIDISVVINI